MFFLCFTACFHLYIRDRHTRLGFSCPSFTNAEVYILQDKRLGRLDYQGFDMLGDPGADLLDASLLEDTRLRSAAASSECLLIPTAAFVFGVDRVRNDRTCL